MKKFKNFRKLIKSNKSKLIAKELVTHSQLFALENRYVLDGAAGATISDITTGEWVPIMIGTNFDAQGDSQAGAADTDLVGDATHASVYTSYNDNSTPSYTADDVLAFRLRIDNPTSDTYFGGVAIVGMDANADGKVDLFFSVDGRNNTQAVRLFDPGTDLNISPSTTSTTPLPSGWLANNGMYPFNDTSYSVTTVSAATDPNWNGNDDLGVNGDTDVFVSFQLPMVDIATVLAMPSPTDRKGVTGPRGTEGIAGFTKDTSVRYVAFTQTQPGTINGDMNGVGSGYDKTTTFADLGTFTPFMSASEPINAAGILTINSSIGDGNLSATEDDAVSLSGTATGQTHLNPVQFVV